MAKFQYFVFVCAAVLLATPLHSEEIVSYTSKPWPFEPKITPLMQRPEVYRKSLEVYREGLEEKRKCLESDRDEKKIENKNYEVGIDKYKDGINKYRDGMKKYKERL